MMNTSWSPRVCVLMAWSSMIWLATSAEAATITVTNLDDSGPGSLRAAIEAADTDGGPTDITFHPSLAGGVISLASPLPALPIDTSIDGDLEGDCDPDIAIIGGGTIDHGLRIHSPGCAVRGLAVNGFAFDGIVVGVQSGPAVPAVIECSYFGVQLDGVSAHPNGGSGVSVGTNAGGTRVGPGNIAANNGGAGVYVSEFLDLEAYPEFTGLTADAVVRFAAVDFPDTCGALAAADGTTPIDGGGHPFIDNFGLRLTGTVTVGESGDYTFEVTQLDDMVRVVVDGGTVLDLPCCDGASAEVFLGAGPHDLEVDFLEAGGSARLNLEIDGPGEVSLSSGGQPGLLGELFQLRLPVEGVTITENSIFDNFSRGIELQCGCGAGGDAGDLDLGPNTCLNPPVFTGDTALGGREFEVAGTAAADAVVEVFASAGDPSGHGEGRTQLATVTADSNGDFDAAVTLPPGFYGVTATATATDGSTSEFSRNHGLVTHNITVTSSDDSGPGTLRDALEQSIADGAETIIAFHPSLAGATIALESPLPAISDDWTTIDGDIDADCWPDIELDGSLVDDPGLRVQSSGNIVRGLVINRFASDGILISANEISTCASNTVACCFLGTDPTGTTALPNGRTNPYSAGVAIDSCAGNSVGGARTTARNLLSGNLNQGVNVRGPGATGNLIAGNLIGTDVSGTFAIPNSYSGIDLQNADGNTVGGARATHGNLVSGNVVGINVYGSSNVVAGNLVGTDLSGTAAIPNTDDGIVVSGGADDNLIGGVAATHGNVVSGNVMRGILIINEGTDANRVEGNFLGTDIIGTAALGNGWNGVAIYSGAGNIVGSTDPARRNVIGGNEGPGVSIWFATAVGNRIIGNWIGIGSDGATPLGNGAGVSVWLEAGETIVGGPGGAANWIAFNDSEGVVIATGGGAGNTVSRNSIHDNGGLGIDLGEGGVDLNDPGDGDDGPNHLVNAPVIASAVTACGSGATTITGTVDTTDPDDGLVELFGSPAGDPSGHGEGEAFLAQTVPAFNGAFTYVVPAQPTGSVVTATFTDADGNTSEFSNAVVVQTTPLAPAALQATAASGPAVDLSWLDNAAGETGFRIERREAGTPTFVLLTNVAANTTSFQDAAGLTPGTTYYYRVRSEGTCASAWSNVASASIATAAAPAFCRTTVSHHESALQPVLEHGNGFFGAAWRECDGERCAIAYARLDLTGAVVAGPVIVTPWADQSAGPRLAWNGGEWGLSWFERLGDEWGLFFERLTPAGALASGPIRIDGASEPTLPDNSRARGLAWNGSDGWGIVWRGAVGDIGDVFFAFVDADGRLEKAETVVDDSTDEVAEPLLVHDGGAFSAVWLDHRADPPQFFLRRIGSDGTPLGAAVQVTISASFTGHPDLAWSGSEHGLAWVDTREGDSAVFFTRFSGVGAVLSGETRLSDAIEPGVMEIQAWDLVLRHLGDRWAVASEDWRWPDGTGQTQLSFADATGARLGGDLAISGGSGDFWTDYPALAWSGSVLLGGWFGAGPPDTSEIRVQAMDASGDPGSNPLRTLTSGHLPGGGATPIPVVAATNDGFAAAWLDSRAGRVAGSDLLLRLADASGVPVGIEVEVADAGADGASAINGPHIAFSGEVMAVLWRDANRQLYLSRFNTVGGVLGPDIPLGTSMNSESLLWTGEVFLAAWCDPAPGNVEIMTAAVAADGTVLAPANRISYATRQSRGPSLSGDGRARAVAWYDQRDGDWEIFAAALDPLGRRLGDEVQVTDDPLTQAYPSLSWNGSAYLVAWRDWRDPSGMQQVWARRLAADATPVGAEWRLSDGWGLTPKAAWDGSAWGVVFADGGDVWYSAVDAGGVEAGPDRLVLRGASDPNLLRSGSSLVVSARAGHYFDREVVLLGLPCALDDTAPGCPTELAVALAGADAELNWTPGSDTDGGSWWQAVYRDGERIAVIEPAESTFADLMVPVADHTYTVTVFNLAGLESASCPTAFLDEEAWTQPLFADDFESGTTQAWSATVP